MHSHSHLMNWITILVMVWMAVGLARSLGPRNGGYDRVDYIYRDRDDW